MWRGREPPLDRETVAGIIRLLMRIEANVDRILSIVDEEDDGEEEADA